MTPDEAFQRAVQTASDLLLRWQLTVDVLALLAATALLLATGWPWIAVIAGVLTLVYGGLRWWVNAHVKRLRTHLKEDQ